MFTSDARPLQKGNQNNAASDDPALVPLDPWAFISAPAFRLHDGGSPEDIEVHAAERKDRLFKHAADYYWTHPVVVEGIKAAFGVDRPE
jgi:hypothetical protein